MVYNCNFPFSDFISIEIYIILVAAGFGLFIYSMYRLGLLERYIKFSLSGLILLIFGGIYNLSNRYINGCVADPYSFFNLFSFNFADVLISFGFVILLIVYLLDSLKLDRFVLYNDSGE